MMFQKNKKRLVILVSNAGTGTNLKAIITAVGAGYINAEIVAVVCDKVDAPALAHAREPSASRRINIEICEKKENLLEVLKKLNPDFIALAGWKQIILDEVILAYPNRILNLHPGLIPDTTDVNDNSTKNPDGTIGLWNKGMLTTKAIQNFLDNKCTYASSSIHFLTLNFDFGPVLARCFEKIEKGDDVDSLYSRLKKKENELYIEVLQKLCN